MPSSSIKPPTLAEVIHLQDHAPHSLEAAAASINRHIDLFTRAAGTYQSHRVRAGHELIAVRKHIPEGEWESWCADNIHRSQRDIRKLIALACTGHPEMAAEQERSEARERMRAHRANVRPPQESVGVSESEHRSDVGPVDDAFRLFKQLDEEQRAEFFALVEKEMETWKRSLQ